MTCNSRKEWCCNRCIEKATGEVQEMIATYVEGLYDVETSVLYRLPAARAAAEEIRSLKFDPPDGCALEEKTK